MLQDSRCIFVIEHSGGNGWVGGMSVPQRLLFLTTAFCFLLSVIIHAASFFGVAFYPAIFMVPLLFIIWPMVVWQWRRVPRRNLVLEVFGSIPLWMKVATGALLLYVFVSFFLAYGSLGGGNPVKLPDGRLVLQKGAEIVRVLTAEEFQHANAVQVRLLSGHLLAFYGVALIALQAFYIKTGPAMATQKVSGR